MERNPPAMKQARLMQDGRTGSLGVTLPSKRRSEPDLTQEEESESDEAPSTDYEYICTNMVSSQARHLNDIVILTMSRHEVSKEVREATATDHILTQTVLTIDPKASLRARYPTLLPDSCLAPERVRELASISAQLCGHRALTRQVASEDRCGLMLALVGKSPRPLDSHYFASPAMPFQD